MTNLIGIYGVRAADFGRWASLGIDAVIGHEKDGLMPDRATRVDYCAAAQANGLAAYISPSDKPSVDVTLPAFAGWVQPDEADGRVSPTAYRDTYFKLKGRGYPSSATLRPISSSTASST